MMHDADLEAYTREAAEWFGDLCREFPGVKVLYDEHLLEWEELLSTIFMSEVERYCIDVHERWLATKSPEDLETLTRLLGHFEDKISSGNETQINLICVSFLEEIDKTDGGKQLATMFGPKLTAMLDKVDRWWAGESDIDRRV